MKVKLNDVVEALAISSDESAYYYNKETEALVFVMDPIFGCDDQELLDDLEENGEKYIRLPSKYEINEYQLMRAFIRSLPPGKVQKRLERAIRGSGAFRYFKDTLYDLGIEKQWYECKDEEFRKIAIRWCEENGIEYK
ncbi:Uncharacterised protein family (UPF0158) [uncultured Eubacterium sp.]|nr:Uncharacterised protein family (UPF0158) [uncultured Eubacterium sp.]